MFFVSPQRYTMIILTRAAFCVCLLPMSSLFASCDAFIVLGDDNDSRAFTRWLPRPFFEVASDHLVLNLAQGKWSCGFVTPPTTPLLAQANEQYNQVQSVLPHIRIPVVTRMSERLNGVHMTATQKDVSLSHHTSLSLKENIFCAQGDVTVTAPILTFESTFLTSHTGKITLKAPEQSPGWLRALAFERAEGLRPFDVMLQGTVSFATSQVHELYVVGAFKVTMDVRVF
ncbi:MAG: hypothetical protein C0514_05050 [Candidatus Puniceispirillum sp.]|nr:hypothetical protein [Candidatus Puniceispirillum sp.]